MAKVKVITYIHDGKEYHHPQLLIWCDGCGWEHALNPQVHTFNGDFNNPTFSPSLLQNHDPKRVCHSFVVDGKIQYLGDCFHSLAGQTLELKDVDEMIAQRESKL